MGNFDFLRGKEDYAAFAPAAIEAEKVYATSPAMCAIGCRKALELAVKWVYVAENIPFPFRDNLQTLVHEPDFRYAMEYDTWKKLQIIIKLGNMAVHTGKNISAPDAVMSLRALFEFIEWIDYCYGAEYTEHTFKESLIPQDKVTLNEKEIKEQASLLQEKEEETKKLYEQIQMLSKQLKAEKEKHKEERHFNPETISEFKTRKIYIDVDLKMEGWIFDGPNQNVWEEYEVSDMNGVPGQKGYIDYVLFGRDGRPLAVIEAKRTSKDPNVGRKQASLYADCLERKYGRRPMIFNTNGFETYYWDSKSEPQRQVSGIFGEEDLQRLMNRREEGHTSLLSIKIDERITNRSYQMEAIAAVCSKIEQKRRKHLLVMATGTGKTRTAASLVDVLSKGNRIKNVLFLADRTALVAQAKDAFREYLPDMSLCNLCSNKEDKNARIIFSTYPTILNAIDDTRSRDGLRLFSPAHFDLIIIDESHRSIFKKYRAIFDYFDAILVGLTATPKTDVDRNTYEFFELPNGQPTYEYGYKEAIDGKYLVPYYTFERTTKFLEEGIKYDDLSEEEKEKYEEFFTEDDGSMPEIIPSKEMNRYIFNIDTVDHVLQDLMNHGIKVKGGDQLGKTIIFAQNKNHAEFITKRFNALYPQYHGTFAERVVCGDAYVDTTIADFKQEDKEPVIAVSVDMLDTGIDVPECVNLVFFKPVRSKTKFWQMIGRGTRLCPDLSCFDLQNGEYTGKRYFYIFGYCGNFTYFSEHLDPPPDTGNPKTLSESIFIKRVGLIKHFQEIPFADEAYQKWRSLLVDICHRQIESLNPELASVRLRLRYVEKYKNKDVFQTLTDSAVADLDHEIAPLVKDVDKDETAKRFDNLMYGLMLASIRDLPSYKRMKSQILWIVQELKKITHISFVKKEIKLLNKLETSEFWSKADALQFEEVRIKLRDLIKFIPYDSKPPIVTNFKDKGRKFGDFPGTGIIWPEAFETYQERVNRYFTAHINDVDAIRKLVHNEPLTEKDYKDLERIFTQELGSKEDYETFYQNQPFGLTVRHIAKLDKEAAEKAFAQFINSNALNTKQIEFIKTVINYVSVNGYMESPKRILEAPFDKPYGVTQLFSQKELTDVVKVIRDIRERAEKYE